MSLTNHFGNVMGAISANARKGFETLNKVPNREE